MRCSRLPGGETQGRANQINHYIPRARNEAADTQTPHSRASIYVPTTCHPIFHLRITHMTATHQNTTTCHHTPPTCHQCSTHMSPTCQLHITHTPATHTLSIYSLILGLINIIIIVSHSHSVRSFPEDLQHLMCDQKDKDHDLAVTMAQRGETTVLRPHRTNTTLEVKSSHLLGKKKKKKSFGNLNTQAIRGKG